MRTKTAIEAAMMKVGLPTTEFRLRELAQAALDRTHRNRDRARKHFERSVGDDGNLISEALWFYLQHFDGIEAARLLGGGQVVRAGDGPRVIASSQQPDHRSSADSARFNPGRTSRGLASIAAIQETARSGLMFTMKTHDGVAWGDVGYHELSGRDRDGVMSRLLRQKIGVPHDQFAKVCDLLTTKQYEEVCDEARKLNSVG